MTKRELIQQMLTDPDDRDLFGRGYECQRGSFDGDWDVGAPPQAPQNRSPAYLLGNLLYLYEKARSWLPQQNADLLERSIEQLIEDANSN